jgi:hypothetical protein
MLWLYLLALAEDLWLTPDGAGGFAWGTSDVPEKIIPKRKDYFLPDSGIVTREAPADWEVLGAPQGERRFMRYFGGVLVDAWLVSTHSLSVDFLSGELAPDWTGVVLGPAEDGYRAYGIGRSWTLSGRTLFHWRDRLGEVEIIASRAIPPPQYGVQRAEPLASPVDSGAKAQFTGLFKPLIKLFQGKIASCFDQVRMPVEATILLRLDGQGMPARIKVDSTQPSFNLDTCVAGAIQDLRGAPNSEGSLEMLRFR